MTSKRPGWRPAKWALLWLGMAGVAAAQAPAGPELQVHPQRSQSQEMPSVGLAQDGSALLVYAADDSGNKRVRALDRRGEPAGEPPSLHLSPEEGYPLGQSLSLTRAGGGVACFAGGGPCLCRFLDTEANLGPAEIRCSERQDFNGLLEVEPDVATFGDGHFVVAWLEFADGIRVFVRLFSAAGAPLSAPVLVAGELDGALPLTVAVAALADGQAMVVWNGYGLDGGGHGIRGRRVAANGELAGAEFVVNTRTAGDQVRARAASNLEDRWVAVWESFGQDGSGGGIYGQLFDRAGNRLGGEFAVTTEASSDQSWPEVAMDRSGRFSVSFTSAREDAEGIDEVYLRSFDAGAAPLGPQVRVNPPNFLEEDFPAIAQADNGLVEVSYQSFRDTPADPEFSWDVMTRRFVLPCQEDEFTLCLAGGRFAVRAFWRDPAGREALARKIALVGDTGGFYFFDPTNFELLVKVLDGCHINQNFWVFAAGLTDVEVDLLITDSYTGRVEAFHNPAGQAYAPVQQIGSFPTCDAPAPAPGAEPARLQPEPLPATPAGAGCSADPTTLCLDGGRYRVIAQWGDFAGASGPATAFPQSGNSGLFYFFSPNNLELAVKVLDGCAINGHRWVFAAGLTDVEVGLTVEEVATGTLWQRQKDLGIPFAPILDTAAFPCPGARAGAGGG